MLLSQSCIVADPPEYRAPGQTRPVLNVYTAVPTATEVLVVTGKASVKFTVGVRSEDAGEDLRAVFYLDYQVPPQGPERQRALNSQTITASTYENAGRTASYSWPPDATSFGCHFLSLIVAHRSTFLESIDENRLDPRRAPDDAAIVTWTVNVDDASSSAALEDCPTKIDLPAPVQ